MTGDTVTVEFDDWPGAVAGFDKIEAALTAADPSEPVAWVVQLRYSDRWSGEMLTDVLPKDRTDTYRVLRPLYEAPPAAPDASNLISVIADIREKSGVGAKPMLSELADAIAARVKPPRHASPVIAFDNAVAEIEASSLAIGAYMPALATRLRIWADSLADRYPDDANGGTPSAIATEVT